jgi:NAD(P)H-hydrate epimerase
MYIQTSSESDIAPFIQKMWVPQTASHKGQNGRVLIVGGSTLFHAASLWAAEVASHFTDMVHYSSTEENNEVFLSLKKIFRNGIIVHKKDILSYVDEDDAILIGPGMVREKITDHEAGSTDFKDILEIRNEARYTRALTSYFLRMYPQKRFVLDAGALQMMDVSWLKGRKEKVIITPHQEEFHLLFGEDLTKMENIEEKAALVQKYAAEYGCVIMLKAVDDIISDGTDVFIVQGGNQGLTKGGSGDVLAGLTVSLYTKNDPVISCILASYAEKKAAEELALTMSYWYNINNLIQKIPEIFQKLHYN